MQKYQRILSLKEICASKSAFLLGPRQTGKSHLIREELSGVRVIDLLKSEIFLEFQRAPQKLRQVIPLKDNLIVIDEIQRVPELLNEVHLLIEEKGILFLLTGSSARKLRRSGVNLLGGRARNYYLHPLTSSELGSDFDLNQVLHYGSLPSVINSDEPRLDLNAYVENYLQLEISAEALTRNIPAFSRFLEISALCNGAILNYTKIANDAQIAPSTVQEYFQILRDTLMGFDLPAWKESKKRKASRTSKFYFFDIGVVNAILGRWEIREKSTQYGENLESWIFHELRSYTDYYRLKPLSYWRSQQQDEVDFILDGTIAIEVKAASRISKSDLRGLRKLRQELEHSRFLLVCPCSMRQEQEGIEIWPVEEFLGALWGRELL